MIIHAENIYIYIYSACIINAAEYSKYYANCEISKTRDSIDIQIDSMPIRACRFQTNAGLSRLDCAELHCKRCAPIFSIRFARVVRSMTMNCQFFFITNVLRAKSMKKKKILTQVLYLDFERFSLFEV